MAEYLQTNGIDLIPASKAGSLFGYTGDYVTRLAREGKVVGEKVGRQWFVLLPSLTEFVNKRTEEKLSRSESLRQERKSELRSKDADRILKQHMLANQDLVAGVQGTRMIALAQTLLILVAGFTIGVGGHLSLEKDRYVDQLAATGTSSVNFFEWMAISFYRIVSPEGEFVAENEETKGMTPQDMLGEEEAGPLEHSGLVVIPEDDESAATIDSIRGSFSDDVEVTIDPENPDAGIIVPQFRKREGNAYRFLMVPLEATKSAVK